ncbi:MAG: hypothetical protein HY681_11145 [Chloroflexi bacterium]|nr:hypothetical protein [Chloroflexota bacterium]
MRHLSEVRVSPLRRLFHMAAGAGIPLVGLFVDHTVMVGLLAALVALAITLETARFAAPGLNAWFVRWFRPCLKESESRKVTGSTYLAIGALACFIFFDQRVAVPAMLFLAVGDPTAALVGRRAPGPRVWGKSPAGTLAFFAVAVAAVWGLALGGHVEFRWALVAGAAAAALAELLPVPLDDNLTVPLAAGAVMTLVG